MAFDRPRLVLFVDFPFTVKSFVVAFSEMSLQRLLVLYCQSFTISGSHSGGISLPCACEVAAKL